MKKLIILILFLGILPFSAYAGSSLLSDSATIVNSYDGVIRVQDGSVSVPAISFVNNTDFGFFLAASNDRFTISVDNNATWSLGDNIISPDGASIFNEAASSTNPSLIPDSDDFETGIGWNADDELSAIAGGVEAVRWVESTGIIQITQLTSGITASTTQTQGQGALLSSFNEISTVANTNDTITLPTAVAGEGCVIINNGANTLQIFPASGDDLGSGADTATTLASGSNITFLAIDATNWETI